MAGANKVAKNSLLYTIANMVTKASTFLLLFIYTNPDLLSTEDYGRVNLLTSFTNIAVLLVNLSLPYALIRFYAEYKLDKEKCKRFFGTIMTFMSVFGTAVVALMILFRAPISGILFSGIEIYPPVICTLLTLVFNALYQMYQSILQAKQQGGKFAKNSLLFFFFHVGLNVILLIFGRGVYLFGFELGGLNGMMLSLFVSNLVFAVYGIVDMLRQGMMSFCIDGHMLSTALKYSVPLLPHNIANNMASYISKHFLNAAGKAFENGIYSVSMQFSSVIEIVQSSIHLAFRPWFNDKMKLGEEGKKEIVDLASVAFRISAIVCLGVALFSQEVVMLLSKDYYDAWKYVPIIAVAHAVKFVYFTHTFGIMYDIKQSKKMFFCSGSAIVVNFTMSYVLTELGKYTMLTAALCFLISRSTAALVSVVICRRNDIIKYNVKEMLAKIILVAAFSVAGLVPINVLYVGLENEVELFSATFFMNFAFKLVVFAVGVVCIIGRKRNEILSLIKGIIKKKIK